MSTRSVPAMLLLVVLANLALVWLLPILPCQDLPQHLAYAKIFADHETNALFQRYYALPERFQPYETTHVVLALIARISSVMTSIRVVMGVYVLLTFAGFHAFASAVHRRPIREPLAIDLLAVLIVWSPATCMGFLPYVVCVPIFLFACASLLRATTRSRPRVHPAILVACSTLLGSIHLVAAGALLAFAILYVAFSSQSDRRRAIAAAAVVSATLLLVFVVWRSAGSLLGERATEGLSLREALAASAGFEAVNAMFRLTWHGLPTTLNYIVWTVLGPFRGIGLVLVAASAAPWIALLRRRIDSWPKGQASLRKAAIAFFVFSALLPWGVAAPSEVTFLSLRMIGLAFALLLALVPPDVFGSRANHRALAAFSLFFVAHFAYRAAEFSKESAGLFRLLDRARPPGVLLSMSFHDESSAFATMFRLGHFLPLYYTVEAGGIDSQFWARYTAHLPIDYRPGMKPAQPDDWTPEQFDPARHLADVDFVLQHRAGAGDPGHVRKASARVEARLEAHTSKIACEGSWCLYRVEPDGVIARASTSAALRTSPSP
jgi:hypothetical protein